MPYGRSHSVLPAIQKRWHSLELIFALIAFHVEWGKHLSDVTNTRGGGLAPRAPFRERFRTETWSASRPAATT